MNSQKGDVDWEYDEKAGIVPSLSPNPRQTQVRVCPIKSDLKGQRKQQPSPQSPGQAADGLERDPPRAPSAAHCHVVPSKGMFALLDAAVADRAQ